MVEGPALRSAAAMRPRSAVVLRYAALQFVACAALAMACYAGGSWRDPAQGRYALGDNFLSDLGATRAWSGRANYLSAALFSLGLATVGAALVAFAWTWRRFAFARGRAAWAGRASCATGTLAGLAFAGIACTPVDRALDYHNVCVVTAFSLLPIYFACLAIALARNGAAGWLTAANVGYLVVVAGYAALIFVGPRPNTVSGVHTQVVGQKVVVLASMVHVVVLTTAINRAARAPTPTAAPSARS